MSDKPDKKADAAAAAKKDDAHKEPAPAAGGGLLAKTPVLLGGVMLIEAIVLFAGFKFIGGGAKPANGADLTSESHTTEKTEGKGESPATSAKQTVEIQLLDSKFPNKVSGRTFLYDVSIFITVKSEFETRIKEQIKDRDALIKDRVRTIIAQSDPEKLGGGSEPGLETLRRQVKFQLDEILGDDMIVEVLIPRCIPFRTDF